MLAFWKPELGPESWALTVFHWDEKIFPYKRLIIGVKPTPAELDDNS